MQLRGAMTGMALAPLPATSITQELTNRLAGREVVASPPVPRRGRRARRPTLAAGDRVGVWRIDAELGRGGMGAVLAVTHSKFGKRAALKLCHASILRDGFTAETFLREARIVHRVDHPGVCDVFATGTYRGRPYLAMERLAGETLGARLERGPLPREDALELLLEICDVLGAAHAAGVVHRDLKLDNVFVLEVPGAAGRRTKLLDWGVAHVLGEPDPMRGMIAGTLTYVAPEQVRGDAIDPAADIYSLAVLAYQVLLGAPPFASKDDLELLRMHLGAAPPPPARLWPDIPGELAATLAAMLAKDPAQRPPVAEVRRVLERARAALAAPAPAAAGDPTPAPAALAPAPADARRAWMRRVRGWLARLAAVRWHRGMRGRLRLFLLPPRRPSRVLPR
jgi:serine/threonine-protein kinase